MHKPSITFVISRQGKVLRRETAARAVIRIGRHRSNHLQLDDEHVSKRHAVIEVAADRITLVDLAEEPSVRVNGQWIDEATLAVGDRIQIGSSEILIEDIAMQEAEAPVPAAGAAAAAPAPERAAPPSASSVPAAALRQAYTYAFFGGGPAPRPEEVELTHVLSAEVNILWGDNVLHVAHLSRGQAFWVGDEHGPRKRCDFLIPREKLGASRLPLVIGQGSGFALVIAPQALGHVTSADGSLHTLDVLRESARGSAAATGGCVLPLGLGMRAELRFGDIVFRIAAVRAGKPVGHGLASGLDASAWPYFALSALSLGGLLSSMAFWVPPLSLLEGEESDDDRLYLLQAYLDAAAERETIREPERGGAEASAGSAGESGAAAAGAQGAMGTPEAPSVPRRWASKGNADRRDRQLPREATRLDPDFGMLGLLGSRSHGELAPLPVPWGADSVRGSDALNAAGALWASDLGDVAGTGLRLTGPGQGGGGRAEGIGVGTIGTLGPAGGRDGDGLGVNGPGGPGWSHGNVPGSHRPVAPRLRSGETRVSGRLPPETIQRVVRQNYSRFRLCYEKGLMTNRGLTGRVGVRFVIGRDGSVTHVSAGDSDLPDPKVVSCVSRAFYDISFPKPEGGVVTVVYPIVFQPE